MFRTLYAKLAVALVLLLFAIGLFYAVLSTSLIDRHLRQANQHLHRDLAHNLVKDRNLVREGQIDEAALKQTFHDYMVINPSIEIYLLDPRGAILAFSADPGKVKRKHVSLEPIRAFLNQQKFPLLGDDPRSHDRQKIFSVTPVPSATSLEGYLYVVLQGEEFDIINDGLRDRTIFRVTLLALGTSLFVGVLAGLAMFYELTRRLRVLARRIDNFRESNYSSPPESEHTTKPTDEIDQLGAAFEHMAERIVVQFRELQENDNQRRELIAQVSHDLRTPLASLHGYLETLSVKRNTLSAEAQHEYLNIALRHSNRLSNLVDALFELAKLDANEQLVNKEPFVIAELLQDVAQKYYLRAEQLGRTLSIDIPDDNTFVFADIGLIERVLENLIDNAFAHTATGDRVTLGLTITNDEVLITTADTGTGIPSDELPYIFDPFYQGKTVKHQSERSGLGLAIVKRIIEFHSTSIEVTSSESGTVFSFTLPEWNQNQGV